jgi:hypothetical protein
LHPRFSHLLAGDYSQRSDPERLDVNRTQVRCSAISDVNASINTSSNSKANFWKYAESMYHFYLSSRSVIEPEQGFHDEAAEAQRMPGDGVALHREAGIDFARVIRPLHGASITCQA